MKRCLIAVVFLFAGCTVAPEQQARHIRHSTRVDAQVSQPETPAVNLPIGARARNRDGGSCVFVSIESCLHWQNQSALAAEIRRTCKGGSTQGRLHANLDRLRIPYAATSSGDVAFIEWACKTRRGAMVFFYPNHAVTLVGMTDTEFMLLDNNAVTRFPIKIQRDRFIREWRGYGGAATAVLVSSPSPPL